MTNIRLSKEIADKLNEGIKFGSGQELPFPVLYMHVKNGQEALEPIAKSNPAAYYGGFVADAEPMEALLAQGLEVPTGFVGPVKMSVKGGKSYQAYTARFIFIAPIGYRKSWVNKDTRERRPEKVGIQKGERGFRHHMQVLAYMGYKTKDEMYLPWNPVVISAYGWQVDRLTAAFNDWNRHTVQARNLLSKEVGATLPAWAFYLAVGTFGKERVEEMVGKKGFESPITPVRAFLPDPLPENLMDALFVGEDIAQRMAEMRDEAQDWLNAWNRGMKDESTPTGADEYGGGENYVPPEPEWDEQEEPF